MYTEARVAAWLFPQQKPLLTEIGKCIAIGELL